MYNGELPFAVSGTGLYGNLNTFRFLCRPIERHITNSMTQYHFIDAYDH